MRPMTVHARVAIAVAGLLASCALHAADLCPVPPHYTPRSAAEVAADDHLIHIETDNAAVTADGLATVSGHVAVRQDARVVTADTVTVDRNTGRITVKGAVDFLDPKVRISSQAGSYDQAGGAAFSQAAFQLFEHAGRGYASDIEVRPGGLVSLLKTGYTTCPPGKQDWLIRADSIDLDTARQSGVAHNMKFDFEGVPVLYLPYFSFPLGDERKSGFLFPSVNHSGSDGLELPVPYYFNLAPNYDLTLTPEELTTRGTELSADFRYLTAGSHGEIEGTFLPDDRQTGNERSYLRIRDISDLSRHLRADVDIQSVSDSNYFQDFAIGSTQTSVTYLERRADLLYQDDAWKVRAQLQNFQTIDISVDAAERPYSRVPRVDAEGLWPLGNGFEFALNGEAVNFLRDVGPSGIRLDLAPELRWSLRTAGYFVEPAIGWRATQYDLQDPNPGDPSAPTRTLPYARLDTGLVFERDAGAGGQRSETLEPRLLYSYVPYRNQDGLPVFDTALPDLNLSELFRTNRYVGADRISDANLISFGVTTRLFDQETGQQYLSATLGKLHYFTAPRVTLPGESPLENQTNDYVGELSLTTYRNWTVNLAYQWNPDTSLTGKSEVLLQYRPGETKVLNLAYRYQPGLLDQWDASFAWPIAGHWSSVGRMVYSMKEQELLGQTLVQLPKQTIEQVAGIEYRNCCWKIDIVQRRYVNSRGINTSDNSAVGALDTSIAVQLELIGLSSVARPGNSFLERSIGGYSPYGPAP
jgi:LPS-assembly protein